MTYLLFALIIILFGIFIVIKNKFVDSIKTSTDADLSVYKKKAFLFDSVAELKMYKILVKNYGDRYFIFSQVNYSHLIEPKKSDWKEEKKYRSRIDRKSADFVLCDKERVVPELVIELDGPSHLTKKRQARDAFVDSLSDIVGMQILHITTDNLEEQNIVDVINAKIQNEKTS